MTEQLLHNTLQAIFTLSRATLPVDAASLARQIGTSPTRVAEALVVLEQRGWVDASRARLTMLGLAKAVASGVPNTRVQDGVPAEKRQAKSAGRRGASVPPSRTPSRSPLPSELPIAAVPRLHH